MGSKWGVGVSVNVGFMIEDTITNMSGLTHVECLSFSAFDNIYDVFAVAVEWFLNVICLLVVE